MMSMIIKTAYCSYRGGRNYNEDCVRIHQEGENCAVTVADGLGGHGGGQEASSIAAEVIREAFAQTPKPDRKALAQIYMQANQAVLARQTDREKMKSTGVSLFISKGSCIWAHAGDSRLYYFDGGRLTAQTQDHSVSQMAVFSGEITAAQIRHHPDRNRVLKAFGMPGNFQAEVSERTALKPGFHAFLLCSDGFWEYVWELEMEIELAKAETPDDWIHAMMQRIASRVPTGHDNCSAAAVFVYA